MKNQFSKKHYTAIASAIRIRLAFEGQRSRASHGLRLAAVELSHVFASDNPRFDSYRFLEAAGATFVPRNRLDTATLDKLDIPPAPLELAPIL